MAAERDKMTTGREKNVENKVGEIPDLPLVRECFFPKSLFRPPLPPGVRAGTGEEDERERKRPFER